MKTLISIFCFLFATITFGQEVEPKYERIDDLIRATFYHDNGEINQVGYFKRGKPHGEWVSYDLDGNKLSEGNYDMGIKTGKWSFWNDKALSEVNYDNNEIADVKVWEQETVIVHTSDK